MVCRDTSFHIKYSTRCVRCYFVPYGIFRVVVVVVVVCGRPGSDGPDLTSGFMLCSDKDHYYCTITFIQFGCTFCWIRRLLCMMKWIFGDQYGFMCCFILISVSTGKRAGCFFSSNSYTKIVFSRYVIVRPSSVMSCYMVFHCRVGHCLIRCILLVRQCQIRHFQSTRLHQAVRAYCTNRACL